MVLLYTQKKLNKEFMMKRIVLAIVLMLTVGMLFGEATEVSEMKEMANELEVKSLEAIEVLEDNMAVIDEIVAENVDSVLGRIEQISAKFGDKFMTKSEARKFAGVAGTTAVEMTKEVANLFVILIVVKRVAGFVLAVAFLAICFYFLRKFLAKAIWTDEDFNSYAVGVILTAVGMLGGMIGVLTQFVGTVLALFAPNAYALSKLIAMLFNYTI